jgi:hypothetical protein
LIYPDPILRYLGGMSDRKKFFRNFVNSSLREKKIIAAFENFKKIESLQN